MDRDHPVCIILIELLKRIERFLPELVLDSGTAPGPDAELYPQEPTTGSGLFPAFIIWFGHQDAGILFCETGDDLAYSFFHRRGNFIVFRKRYIGEAADVSAGETHHVDDGP